MFINDVGQNTWEEINEGVAGANYGWPDTEGPTSDPSFDSPVYAYQHGRNADRMRDHRRRLLQPATPRSSRRATTATTSSPTTAAAGSASSIRRTSPSTQFATGISSPGRSEGLRRRRALLPRARQREHDRRGREDHLRERAAAHHVAPVEPHGRASASRRRSRWRRSGTAPLSLPVAAQRREHRGRDRRRATRSPSRAGVRQRRAVPRGRDATLRDGDEQRGDAHRHLQHGAVGHHHPAGRGHALQRRADDQLRRHGHGSPRTGTLPAAAFTWEVVFHHDTHTHPFMQPTSGITSGSFVIPTTGRDGRERLVPDPPDGPRLGRAHAHDVPRRPAAHGAGDAGHEPGRTPGPDRRPARHDADDVHGRRRHQADARGRVAADVGQHDLRVPVVVGRRRGTHDISTPATNTTYTATFAPTQGGHRERPVGDLLRQRELHRARPSRASIRP